MFANMASFSVEVIEAENPLEVLDYGIVPDTGGPGKYRGGMALRRTWRMLADEGILQVRSDRATHRPYGLHGGCPGTPSRNVLNPGQPDEQALHAKVTMTLRRGDVFRTELAGAGGWGDPLARDPALIEQDLREGLVSLEAARRDYGVVADGDPPRVDRHASEMLRNRLRGSRGELPRVAWQPPAMAAESGDRFSPARSLGCDAAHRHRHRRHVHRPRRHRLRWARADAQGRVHAARLRRGHRRRSCGPARRRRRGCRGAACLDHRLQHHPGGQGRAHRADHHAGLPRHPGNPRPAHAAPVRLALEQAAGPDRAPAAAGSDREDAPGRQRRRPARPRQSPKRHRHITSRERRQRRHLPAAQLREPGARTGRRRCDPPRDGRRRDLGQPRDPTRDKGVSAHQHHGHQRLREADLARLYDRPGRPACRARRDRAAEAHAVERRAGLGPFRRRSSRRG